MAADASSAEKGQSMELEDRNSAPAETRTPLMRGEDEHEPDEHETAEQKHARIMKEMKDLNKELKKEVEELTGQERAQKYGVDAYFAAFPVVSIAMIVIGSLYLDECLVQPYIPVYLVVCGSVGIVNNIIYYGGKCICKDSGIFQTTILVFSLMIQAFLIVWFILGCVWIYGVTEVDYEDPISELYCDKTLYLFAFWLQNISFIVLGIFLLINVCLCCCVCFMHLMNIDVR